MQGFSTSVRIRITSPVADGLFPPDQPLDLLAHGEDVSGMRIVIDHLDWLVDTQPAAHGEMAAIRAPTPGRHEIQASGLREGQRVESDRIWVTVAERNEAQEEFAGVVADLPPLDSRRRQTNA